MTVENNNCSSDLLRQQIITSRYKDSRPYCWPSKEKINPKLKKNNNNKNSVNNLLYIISIKNGENNFLFKTNNKKNK